jgi:hypothetical protein
MKFKVIVSGFSSIEWKNNYLLLKEFIKDFGNIDIYNEQDFGFYVIESSFEDLNKIKELEYIVCIHSIILPSRASTFPSS